MNTKKYIDFKILNYPVSVLTAALDSYSWLKGTEPDVVFSSCTVGYYYAYYVCKKSLFELH